MNKCDCRNTTPGDLPALLVMVLIGLLTAINEWSIPIRESRVMAVLMGAGILGGLAATAYTAYFMASWSCLDGGPGCLIASGDLARSYFGK